jgi:hypothetical protein
MGEREAANCNLDCASWKCWTAPGRDRTSIARFQIRRIRRVLTTSEAMPLRFTRRVSLIPGFRLNASRGGLSLSVGM